MSYGFCCKYHVLSSSAKFKKNRYDLTKLESLKVGTFLRHSVVVTKAQAYAYAKIGYVRMRTGTLFVQNRIRARYAYSVSEEDM